MKNHEVVMPIINASAAKELPNFIMKFLIFCIFYLLSILLISNENATKSIP